MRKDLFESKVEKVVRETKEPVADTINEAGGRAYSLDAQHALAQLVSTGFLGGTYYVGADEELGNLLDAADKCLSTEWVAKCSLYARQNHMKDTPVVLLAFLSHRDPALACRIFDRIIDNGKVLRNFCRVMRSGQISGKKAFPRPIRRKIRDWFDRHDLEWIFRNSVGSDPSMADVIKMLHPKPKDEKRADFYRYLIGKADGEEYLPLLVRQFEGFKADQSNPLPKVPHEMLTSLPLSSMQWAELALNGGWHFVRMNLNTFKRHGVFAVPGMVQKIADRICDEEEIRKSRVFPYQIMATEKNIEDIPGVIHTALARAMDLAMQNVPVLPPDSWVFVDVSGSMGHSVSGHRPGATSKVRCIDVGALIGASFLRTNPSVKLMAVDTRVYDPKFKSDMGVFQMANDLASYGGGGTNLSEAFKVVANNPANFIMMISDNESWVDDTRLFTYRLDRMTASMAYWNQIRAQNKNAKLVCLDLTPNTSTQCTERADILNIGGFSDKVFDIVDLFVQGKLNKAHWAGEIEKIVL